MFKDPSTAFLIALAFFCIFVALTCGSDDSSSTGDDDSPSSDTGETGDDDNDADDDDSAFEPAFDITFFVLSDTHSNPNPDIDQTAAVRAVNMVAAEGQWPGTIEGESTGFMDGPVGDPLGVVFTGDITGSGDASAGASDLKTFKDFYGGQGDVTIEYPAYLGLGNHDVDRDDLFAETYRKRMWEYVEQNHKEPGSTVPVTDFDVASRAYSWDWEGVHLLQTHKVATDTQHGQALALEWLADDLYEEGNGDEPIVLFQHFGFDAFGQQDRWWTNQDRKALFSELGGYNVVAIFAGHSHAARNYQWNGIDVVQVNNIKAEIGEGNNDGSGSFAIVRMTDTRFQMMTCRWLNEDGDYELIAPFLVKDY
jgi:cytolysin (calcineurin-like family phosphatase)